VGSVLSDAPLVELAKRHPSSLRALEQIRGIHASVIRRRGEHILAAVAGGLDAPPIPREPGHFRTDPGDAPMISLAEALLRARALQAGMAYELIASRSELEQIVDAARRGAAPPQVRTLEGWRAELVGSDLRALLAGQQALALGPEGKLLLKPVPPPP
jgi:ribonuclease D